MYEDIFKEVDRLQDELTFEQVLASANTLRFWRDLFESMLVQNGIQKHITMDEMFDTLEIMRKRYTLGTDYYE